VKLQIMSDLHFEMHADGGAGLIRELDPTGVDVLVLAGDITMARHYANLESVFKPLAKKYRHILLAVTSRTSRSRRGWAAPKSHGC
jgi:predicted phosphodiesterase